MAKKTCKIENILSVLDEYGETSKDFNIDWALMCTKNPQSE